MREIITSPSNRIVKLIRKVHDRKRGDEYVYIEGLRIVEDCLLSGGECEYLISSVRRSSDAERLMSLYKIPEKSLVMLDDVLFEKVSSTVNPQGIAMIVKEPDLHDSLIRRGDTDIFCVLDNVQDPGNVGTIIRMADAFDFTAVIVTGGTADPYGEKALRASMGSAWHVPVITYSDDAGLINELNSKGITTLAMHLKGSSLDDASIGLPCAFVIGNEGRGLSEEISSVCSDLVKIPMPGKAESLNAASAASIIGYELRKIRDLTL
ncbi:RNA methyltransferase, TrmH family [Ruminococcaceae bacterium YRB3002]|nr:RNA methyltransferase, TrmH family [Ruminococcaceae bacterium YRB3002]